MLTDEELEQEVKLIIMELMLVLHRHGIREVNVGGLMRVIGVENTIASESDEELIVLDEKFTKYIEETVDLAEEPDNKQTLH
jgi:hypothetical protein